MIKQQQNVSHHINMQYVKQVWKQQQLNFITNQNSLSLPHYRKIIQSMSNLKEDFQNHLFNDLHPIVQQQQALVGQNPNMEKPLLIGENSFISQKTIFLSQSQFQNLNFPDHTIPKPQNDHTQETSPYQLEIHHNPLNNVSSPHQPLSFDVMMDKEFKNSSKLQDYQLSQEDKSIFIGGDNVSLDGEWDSFTDQELSTGMGRVTGKRKLIGEVMKLNFKQHMVLGSKVISGLQKNIVSLPFRQPVDIERFKIHDYHQIIKQPMDLRTIKGKISQSEYLTVQQIYSDIELIIKNSMRYNELNPDFIRLTKNFEKSYYKIRRDCERNLRRAKMLQNKRTPQIISQYSLKQLKPSGMVGKHYKRLYQPKLHQPNPQPRQQRNHTQKHTPQFPTNQVDVASTYTFTELIKLAKRIKKLQPQQQIQLFKQIGIIDTMVIDIKTLSTKHIKVLLRQVEEVEKAKERMVMEEEKKDNSHFTVCSTGSDRRL